MSKKIEDQEAVSVDEGKNAVLYLSRLPYGFTDDVAREFFSQFGEIKGVCYPRSKKSGRSKGYMFVLFEDRDVAQIACKTMNGYFMFGKALKCEVLSEKTKIVYDKFRKQSKKFRFIPWQKIFAKKFNTGVTPEKKIQKLRRLLEADEKKIQKLKELKIDFAYPTYKSLIN